jgi:hypothetical protein
MPRRSTRPQAPNAAFSTAQRTALAALALPKEVKYVPSGALPVSNRLELQRPVRQAQRRGCRSASAALHPTVVGPAEQQAHADCRLGETAILNSKPTGSQSDGAQVLVRCTAQALKEIWRRLAQAVEASHHRGTLTDLPSGAAHCPPASSSATVSRVASAWHSHCRLARLLAATHRAYSDPFGSDAQSCNVAAGFDISLMLGRSGHMVSQSTHECFRCDGRFVVRST